MEYNCVQILVQSLEKKNQVLDRIIEQNALQEQIFRQESFDTEAFEKTIDDQNRMLQELDKLDEGFESLYDRVRENLISNKDSYRKEIAHMKELIQQITDKIVTVNAGNMRNQRMAEQQFRQEKNAIRQGVSKSRAAMNYYNNMNKLNSVAPQFYDSKK